KLLRLVGSYIESRRLIAAAIAQRCDFYIVMSDPGLLNYWAAKLLTGVPYALWTMDIYPAAFIANRLVHSSSRLIQFYRRTLQSNPPELLLTLGDRQRRYLHELYSGTIQHISFPIGVETLPISGNVAKYSPGSKPITIGYVGTLGEAHLPKVIEEIAQSIDPERHRLVLSMSGKHASRTIAKVCSYPGVEITDSLGSMAMSQIDIQVVTLRKTWTHICVPSKALSALTYGSAVLYIGDGDSDSWHYVKPAGWRVSDVDKITTWLEGLSMSEIHHRREKAVIIAEVLREQLQKSREQLVAYLASTRA
ncbi:MAG: hypothetical protein AAFR14_12975, partial [Bacteroidota bacterium]